MTINSSSQHNIYHKRRLIIIVISIQAIKDLVSREHNFFDFYKPVNRDGFQVGVNSVSDCEIMKLFWTLRLIKRLISHFSAEGFMSILQ